MMTYRVKHLIHLLLDVTDFSRWLLGVHHDFALGTHIDGKTNAELGVFELATSQQQLLWAIMISVIPALKIHTSH
jgi:hypothetical protein